MEGLEEGEDEAGGVEHVDQDGDNPTDSQHLRVSVKQEEQMCGDEGHLHVHLDYPEHGELSEERQFQEIYFSVKKIMNVSCEYCV